MAGQYIDLRGDRLGDLGDPSAVLARPLVVVDARGVLAVDGDVVRHRLIAHRHLVGVERLAEGDSRIPLRLDRTDGDAVRVAGAYAAIVVRLGVAPRRSGRDEDVVQRVVLSV